MLQLRSLLLRRSRLLVPSTMTPTTATATATASATAKTKTTTMVARCFHSGRAMKSEATATATAVHAPNRWEGSRHWILERGLSVVLLGLVPTAIFFPNKYVDYALGVVIPVHMHIGLQSPILDYFPRHRFPTMNLVAVNSLRAFSLITLYALYQLNAHDVGIREAVKRLWVGVPKKN